MIRLAILIALILVGPALAQDVDLQQARDACGRHQVWVEARPRPRMVGYEAGWERCAEVEQAWQAARKAAEDAAHRAILEKVLPTLGGK